MFDFLKKKKEQEFDFSSVENANPSDEVKSNELGMPESKALDFGSRPEKPEIFTSLSSGSSSGTVTERDIQLILAKIELLGKKIEEMDGKISEVLEVARNSKQ